MRFWHLHVMHFVFSSLTETWHKLGLSEYKQGNRSLFFFGKSINYYFIHLSFRLKLINRNGCTKTRGSSCRFPLNFVFLPFESTMYEFHLSIFNQFSIMIYFTMFNTLTVLWRLLNWNASHASVRNAFSIASLTVHGKLSSNLQNSLKTNF